MGQPFNLKEWVQVYKIVYYPEFGYLLPRYWSKDCIHDDTWLKSQIVEHLFKIKCLLTYFDFVLIPFGHLFTPLDLGSKELYERVFCEKEFRMLVEQGLIIASIWTGKSIEDTVVSHNEFLASNKWKNKVVINADAKSVLNDLLLFERDVSNQSFYLLNKVNTSLDSYTQILGDEMRGVQSVIKKSQYKELIPFVHENFIEKLRHSSSNSVKKFVLSTNEQYFYSGEYGNPGTVIYGMPSEGDSIRRKCLWTDSFSFLYSPAFFLDLLSIFVDRRLLKYFALIPANKIKYMRCIIHFRPAIDFYHSVLRSASIHLDSIREEDLKDEAFEGVKKRLLYLVDDEIPLDTALGIVLSVVGKMVGFGIRLGNEQKNILQRAAIKLSAKFRNHDFFWLVSHIEKLLKDARKHF